MTGKLEAVKSGAGALRWILTGLSGGAGVAILYAVLETIKAHPEFLPQLLSSGVLGFAALMVGMVMFRGELRQFNAGQLRAVAAQEQLAANVGALVAKDDTRAQALEAAVRYMAADTRTILDLVQRKAPEALDGR